MILVILNLKITKSYDLQKDEKTFYSSVSRQTKQNILKNGVKYTLPAAILLLILMFIQTEFWIALLLFCASLVLVTFGFLPYKRLTQLDSHPIKVTLDPKQLNIIDQKNRQSIDYNSIISIEYSQDPMRYGILIHTDHTHTLIPYIFKEDFEKIKSIIESHQKK